MFGNKTRHDLVMHRMGVMHHEIMGLKNQVYEFDETMNSLSTEHEVLLDKLDKFEENFKRFEVMFNEFKGCIAMTRASLTNKSGPKKTK